MHCAQSHDTAPPPLSKELGGLTRRRNRTTITVQLAEAKALFAKMNTEISNLRVRVKMEEEENQQLQNKIQTLKLQLSSASSSSAAPSWA
jgi:predicted  nucleic acid-binding Zn-ribbon protein